jgi:hypothetical protein
MRFNGIEIPQGATISNAYIQFQVDEATVGATSLTIEGEAVDNAATFTATTGNITARARTATSVGWTPAPWTTVGEAEPDQQTPDISEVIQEIVNRPGWTSSNSLVIVITGTGKRTAESYNGVASGAALLHVEYSTAPPGNQPPDCVAEADQTVIYLPTNTVSLTGTVTDDGLPAGSSVSTTWDHVGGTGGGSVTFGDNQALNTTVTFTEDPGTYELWMTADDTELTGVCEITVEVREAPFLADIVVSPDPVTVVIEGSQQFSAEGIDQYGSPYAITPVWTATGGTVSAGGLYTGSTLGQFSVTATEGGVSGTATVMVIDAGTTIEVRVVGSTDDAEEAASGSMYLGSSDLELTFDAGSNQSVGMRFNGIEIPQGATISNAYIQFQVDEAKTEATSLTIEGEAVDNAATFTATTGNITSRARTATAVGWTPAPWTAVGEAGPDQQTPDISSVIQEVVSRPEWG